MNKISSHYEPPEQIQLVNKVSKLNNKVYKAIKKANAESVDDLLAFLSGFLMVEFSKVKKNTADYLGVIKDDVQNVSSKQDLPTNKQLVNRLQKQTYIELNSNLVCAEKELMRDFKQAIKPYKKTPTHITDVKKVLQDEFVKNGGVKVTYKNGAKMPLDKYFAMATRTARSETLNATAIDNALKLGTDYVYMEPANTSCKTCATLGNRVYCISGKDSKYPSVYGVLFRKGYTCIHPHCRCVLKPFFIEDHTNSEMKQILRDSNRLYDLDPRTESQRQAYQEVQAFNHRVWEATKEYEKAKEVFGKDLPSQLDTLPKFRRGHAMKTERYKEIHNTMQAIEKLPGSNPIKVTELKNPIFDKLPFDIKNKSVIITRKQYETHIAKGVNEHDDIFDQISDKLPEIINNPDYIIADKNHKDTILLLERRNEVNIVIKLSLTSSKLSNTIITLYHSGERRFSRMIKKAKILYKK